MLLMSCCCCYLLAMLLADNEKRLTKKVRELNGEIVGNAAKVQTALRLSEEDQTTIVTLKKEVEKAWKLVDASHEKVTPPPHAVLPTTQSQCDVPSCITYFACRSLVSTRCMSLCQRLCALVVAAEVLAIPTQHLVSK